MPDDLSALLYGDEPSALEKAKAMAATLRRQRAIGELGLLSGDKGLGAYGQSQIANADAGQGFINSLPEKRQGLAEGGLMAELNKLKIAKEQGEAATTARRTTAMSNPTSYASRIALGLGKRLGMAPPAGATAEDIEPNLGTAEKAYSSELGLEKERIAATKHGENDKDLKTAEIGYDETVGALDELEAAVKKGWTPVLGGGTGPDAADMNVPYSKLVLSYPKLQGYNRQANEADRKMVMDMLPKPTGMAGLMSREDTILEAIKKYRQEATMRRDAVRKAFGVRPAAVSGPSPDKVAHYKSQLRHGERLAMDSTGKFKALAPGESPLAGYSLVE